MAANRHSPITDDTPVMTHMVMVPHGKWSPKPPSRRMLYYADPYKEPFKAFLDSDEATGCWDSASDMRGIHYYFSDPNTAFGFKVRFG